MNNEKYTPPRWAMCGCSGGSGICICGYDCDCNRDGNCCVDCVGWIPDEYDEE